jgi:hypothetical protein
MDTTLALVVAAIVILITALVVVTIFGNAMTPLGGISSAESVCRTQCVASCKMSNGQSMPLTWDVPTVRRGTDSQLVACGSFMGKTCDACNEWKTGTSSSTPSTTTKGCTDYNYPTEPCPSPCVVRSGLCQRI